MDIHLINSLRAFTNSDQHIVEMSPDETEHALTDLAKKHINDRSRVLWWEGVKSQPTVIFYEGMDGLSLLGKIVTRNSLIELFVTDEDPGPWLGFRCAVPELLSMISQQRYFEYMISDLKHEWLIFDTHHNELICCGSIRDEAQKFAVSRRQP